MKRHLLTLVISWFFLGASFSFYGLGWDYVFGYEITSHVNAELAYYFLYFMLSYAQYWLPTIFLFNVILNNLDKNLYSLSLTIIICSLFITVFSTDQISLYIGELRPIKRILVVLFVNLTYYFIYYKYVLSFIKKSEE